MTCEHRHDVAALLLGALPTDEALHVEEHVLRCDECSQQRRELSVVRSLLDSVDPWVVDDVPADLGDDVVARLVTTRQHRRRHDVYLVLLGAAAAVVLLVAGFVIVRPDSGSAAAQDLELVASDLAPNAWGIIVLHPRIDGTIVDLEAGDLPTDGAKYAVTVNGNDSVLASQTFSVNRDGWAQVLLATSRPMQPGDTIEVQRLDTGEPVTVLRCACVV